MNPNKALWEKGDFTRIAQSMRESGEALVESVGVSQGLKVLTGNLLARYRRPLKGPYTERRGALPRAVREGR